MILFIIKKFYEYNGYAQVTNGLKTSAGFVVDMLKREGHKARLVEAIDGNCIDRLVTEFKPRIVILEALWATPEKLKELKHLHPHVRWVVRIHSETAFLGMEGISLEWLAAYLKLGVEVAFNSAQTREDFEAIGKSLYLPNWYPVRSLRYKHERNDDCSDIVNIGCFGAIRPLKNQLEQALAAIRYARHKGKKLRFHMNGTRQEQGGNQNLKSIEAAIKATGDELVLHPWLEHEEFLELVQKMDFCLQVSISESFNLVSADAVSLGVPLIGSAAIRWLPVRSQAPTDSAKVIAEYMGHTDQITVVMNHTALADYANKSAKTWNAFAHFGD
jgi:hypothetical protein